MTFSGRKSYIESLNRKEFTVDFCVESCIEPDRTWFVPTAKTHLLSPNDAHMYIVLYLNAQQEAVNVNFYEWMMPCSLTVAQLLSVTRKRIPDYWWEG